MLIIIKITKLIINEIYYQKEIYEFRKYSSGHTPWPGFTLIKLTWIVNVPGKLYLWMTHIKKNI